MEVHLVSAVAYMGSWQLFYVLKSILQVFSHQNEVNACVLPKGEGDTVIVFNDSKCPPHVLGSRLFVLWVGQPHSAWHSGSHKCLWRQGGVL